MFSSTQPMPWDAGYSLDIPYPPADVCCSGASSRTTSASVSVASSLDSCASHQPSIFLDPSNNSTLRDLAAAAAAATASSILVEKGLLVPDNFDEKNPVVKYKGRRSSQGHMHGKGVATFLDQSTLEGVWYNGNIEGLALIIHSDGSEFMCFFLRGRLREKEQLSSYKGRKLLAEFEQQMQKSSRSLTVSSTQQLYNR